MNDGALAIFLIRNLIVAPYCRLLLTSRTKNEQFEISFISLSPILKDAEMTSNQCGFDSEPSRDNWAKNWTNN